METLSARKDLFTKLTHIYLIMPFYNYAYDSVELIRSLCHDSRDLWLNNQDAIIRMFTKQTINIENQRIDELTIKVLKRGNRYKLFKFKIIIHTSIKECTEMFYRMLDEMPDLEFEKIKLSDCCDKEFIDMMLQKSIYKTRTQLFRILQIEDLLCPIFSTREYLSCVPDPEHRDMSCYVKHTGRICIRKFDNDMNIDCTADNIYITFKCLQNLKYYSLGTAKFYDSVKTVDISYIDAKNKPNVYKDIEFINEYFKNINKVNLRDLECLPIRDIVNIYLDDKQSMVLWVDSKNTYGADFTVSSKTGYLLMYDCKDRYYIKCTDLYLHGASKYCTTQGEYVIFDYDFTKASLKFQRLDEFNKYYSGVDLQAIDEPVIILHRRFIKELRIDENLQKSLDFEPTQKLVLSLCGTSDFDEELIKYLSNNCFKNVSIKVEIFELGVFILEKFKILTDTIFSCLDVNELKITDLGEDLCTPDFYDKIKHCQSLRKVKFYNLHDADSQIEVIRSNSNIKQSVLGFRECDMTESIIEKVKELLENGNDNSVIIRDNKKLKSISKISQIFNISPISYD